MSTDVFRCVPRALSSSPIVSFASSSTIRSSSRIPSTVCSNHLSRRRTSARVATASRVEGNSARIHAPAARSYTGGGSPGAGGSNTGEDSANATNRRIHANGGFGSRSRSRSRSRRFRFRSSRSRRSRSSRSRSTESFGSRGRRSRRSMEDASGHRGMGALRAAAMAASTRDERVHARVIRRAAISAASDATRGALGCGEGFARRGRGWRVRVRVRAESGEARRKARRPSGLGNLGIVGGRQLRLGRIEDQTHLARARRAVEGEDGRERVARKSTRGARERMREEGGGAFRTDARLVGARRVVSFRGDAFGREAANNRRVGRRVVGRRTHERYRRDRVRCGVGAPVRARECRRAHPAPRRARAL